MDFTEDDYKNLLQGMLNQMAKILASGKTIEIGFSRSGLKLYSFHRRHEQLWRSNPSTEGR